MSADYTEYTSNMSDSGQSSECFEYEYGNFKTDFSPLEQTVMRYSLRDTLSGKVDERDIIYTKREFGVFLDFLEFIMTEAHEMLPFLFEDLDKREVIATAALDLQYYKHKGVWFLMDFVREEFKNAKFESELFKETSVATFVSRCFFLKVGKNYFKRHFSKFFTQLEAEKLDFEIDDYKITDEKILERNASNLVKKVTDLLQIIYSTMDQLPHGVKIVAKMHSELIREYFPQLSQHTRLEITGLFIVNNFYIHALMNPEKYELCTPDMVNLKFKRNLSILSKILQTLASGTPFKGKGSDYMKKVDVVLKSHTQPLQNKLVNLIISSGGLPYTILLDDNLNASIKALSVLHMELCHKSAEIIRMFPTDISEKFCRFMVAIGEHKDKTDFLFDFTPAQQKSIKDFLIQHRLENVYIAKIDITSHEGSDKKKKGKGNVINGFIIVSLHKVWFLNLDCEVETSMHCLGLQKVNLTDDILTMEYSRGNKVESISGTTVRGQEIITNMIRAFKSSFPEEKIGFEVEASPQLMPLFNNVYSFRTFTRCGGFTGIYEAQCTYRDYPLNQSVRWAIENAKEEDKESKHLKTSKFYNGDVSVKEDKLSALDLIPIFYSLQTNMHFTKVTVENMNLIKCFDGLKEYIKRNKVLKSLNLRNVDVGKNWVQLFESYNDNPKHPIRHLDVSNNVMDEKAVTLVGSMVSKYNLTSLYISNVLTTEKLSGALMQDWKRLADEETELKKIDISNAKMTVATIEFIASQFPVNFPDLEKVFLRDIHVSKTSSMVRFLNNLPKLRVLDLSGMKMSLKVIDKTSQDLQEFIHRCSNLEDFYLNRTVMPGDVLKNIIKELSSTKVKLHLKQADFPVEAVRTFSNTFIGLESILYLDISETNINEESLIALLNSLCQNTIIQSINLNHTMFGGGNNSNIVEKIVKLINGGTGLKELRISGGSKPNQQLGTSLLPILESLGLNRTIQVFDCSYHGFGNKGAFALANLLTVNDTLRIINWDGNDIGMNGLCAIADALRINKTLKEFKFPIADCGKLDNYQNVREILSQMVTSLGLKTTESITY